MVRGGWSPAPETQSPESQVAATQTPGSTKMPPIHRAGNASVSKPKNERSSLLEEMKAKQEQRAKHKELKQEIEKSRAGSDVTRTFQLRSQLQEVEKFLGEHDKVAQEAAAQTTAAQMTPVIDDRESTNLYVGSLAQEFTEELLSREFGKFGEIVSIKIMYPRTESQLTRGCNCGFVQFANRKSAEKAKAKLDGKEYFGMCIRIDWGRSMDPRGFKGKSLGVIGSIYGAAMPQAQKLTPYSPGQNQSEGNATSTERRKDRWNKAKTITVNFPEKKSVKQLLDKTAEFVAHHGWEFEHALQVREIENPRFTFLWPDPDPEDPLHVYYRWRVFSFLQGDTLHSWRTETFQVYENGPLWQPPPCKANVSDDENPSSEAVVSKMGMIARLAEDMHRSRRGPGSIGNVELPDREVKALNDVLKNLSLKRSSILTAMVFCLDHASSSQSIASRLCDFLADSQGFTTKAFAARLFLVSDVLHNSHCTKPGASVYRRQFQELLPESFERLWELVGVLSKLAEPPVNFNQVKDILRKVLKEWSEWATFPPLFVRGLEATICYKEQEFSAQDSILLQERWQQWTAMQDAEALERACRLRGLSALGEKRVLQNRLCNYESYWHDKAGVSREPSRVTASFRNGWIGNTEIEFDPELDGMALDPGDLSFPDSADSEHNDSDCEITKRKQASSPKTLKEGGSVKNAKSSRHTIPHQLNGPSQTHDTVKGGKGHAKEKNSKSEKDKKKEKEKEKARNEEKGKKEKKGVKEKKEKKEKKKEKGKKKEKETEKEKEKQKGKENDKAKATAKDKSKEKDNFKKINKDKLKCNKVITLSSGSSSPGDRQKKRKKDKAKANVDPKAVSKKRKRVSSSSSEEEYSYDEEYEEYSEEYSVYSRSPSRAKKKLKKASS